MPPAGGPVQWSQLQTLATGCANDYIVPAETGVRLWKTGTDLDEDLMGDPVLTMQEGVPVLFYNTALQHFQRRVLKVDDRLNFFYVLTDNVSVKGSMKDVRQHDPVTVRVSQVSRVLGGEDALRVCFAHDIQDSHLTLDSGVVVVQGDAGGEIPALDKIMVFMAAPQQHLKKCIDTIYVMAPDHESVMEDAARLVQSHTRNAQLREARKENRRVVHDIMLQSIDPVFDQNARHFTFDLTFSGDSSGSAKVAISIPANIKPTECEAEVNKAAQQHTMTPCDATRFGFAMREATALRSWATTIAPAVFQNGLYGFLQKAPINAQIAEDETLEITLSQIQSGLNTLHSHEHSSNQGVYYAYSSVRASLTGMDQLLTLEKKYSELVNRARAGGVLSAVTPRVTLAGDTLPDQPVEPSSSSGQAPGPSENEMAVPNGQPRFDPPPNREEAPLEESDRLEPGKQRIQEPPKDGPELQDPGYCPCSGKGRKVPDERGRVGDAPCVGGKCIIQ
eukprot:gnl/MRDRNA2_/MRDRNA2_105518_c0_seq1.p1 gnl/MRDRNA2_/MRDRNA2_105518_c0~~gnl/MRDRNA2_/MRDRNA2_105518_c0_seq1.p1  ORF type:complete len:529 (+),score=69.34 gnl/MRDRNA2_/MRDRNA2_105518_c0_seq1:75-1589(+)